MYVAYAYVIISEDRTTKPNYGEKQENVLPHFEGMV